MNFTTLVCLFFEKQLMLRSSIRAGEVEVVAEVPGLISGQTRLQLVAGPAAKIQLRAAPAALPADVVGTAQLIAEILDVHGNRVVDDSTTAISFSISGGPGKILEPDFALASGGQARASLQSTRSISIRCAPLTPMATPWSTR